ncbi:hypothetical protein [Flaviaesturariibacter amylovorans]|uniref:Uncharacterized protein n=1 Tax=Flaviaesturariibacter amylovorans TaxID=1084520 RepID=A0ABP8GN67_9BACT
MKQNRYDRAPERRPVAEEPNRSYSNPNYRFTPETRDERTYKATNRSGGTRDPKTPPEWGEDLVY